MVAAQDFQQILFFFDGNNNDRDDIAALPVAALLANAAGLQDKVTFFYNNNLGEPNDRSQVSDMRKSAAFAEKLGIQTYDYQADTAGTMAELVKILDSGDRVIALQGGPMEAIYRGLEQTSSRNRGNVTLITHGYGTFNQVRNIASRPGIDDVRTWADLKADFKEPTFQHIPDQNNYGDDRKGFRSSKWGWMDSATDPLIQEARELMGNARGQFNDASDAGMLYWAITGEKEGDPQDAKSFLEANPLSLDPPGAPSIAVRYEAELMRLSGGYHDEKNTSASLQEVISLRGGSTDDIGQARFSSKLTGLYDIKIVYYDENDGQGRLTLDKGTERIADLTLDQDLGSGSPNSQTRTSTTIEGVNVEAGEEFILTGYEDGTPVDAEHVRIDYVEFTSNTFDPPIRAGDGLRASYYDDLGFRDLRTTRTDETVDFDWGRGRPTPQVSGDTFSVRWEGYVRADHSEHYTFQTLSDDGVRLWVDGRQLINDWKDHAPKISKGTIQMEAGELVPIQMEYYENRGGAVSQLSWQSQSQQLEIIPQANLYSSLQPSL